MNRHAWIVTGIILLVVVAMVIIFKKYLQRPLMNSFSSGDGSDSQDQVFMAPLSGPITSPFGPRSAPVEGASTFHNGVDIGAALNTPIQAPLDGTVKQIYFTSLGGKQLVLEHAGGWQTGYADLNGYAAGLIEGQTVSQGDTIAYAGKSGPSTGTHLHFTLTNPEGNKVDPSHYFDAPLPTA